MPCDGKMHLIDCKFCEYEWVSILKEPCKTCCYGSKQKLREEFKPGDEEC